MSNKSKDNNKELIKHSKCANVSTSKKIAFLSKDDARNYAEIAVNKYSQALKELAKY